LASRSRLPLPPPRSRGAPLRPLVRGSTAAGEPARGGCNDHQVEPREALKAIERICGVQLLRTRVPKAAAMEQAMGRGVPIFDPCFRDTAAQAAFVALVDEFLTLEEGSHG
jgi:hypothetical protein